MTSERQKQIRMIFDQLEMTRDELLDALTGTVDGIEKHSGLPLAEPTAQIVRIYRARKSEQEGRS